MLNGNGNWFDITRVADRRDRRKIGAHRQHVVVGHFGVGRIRHRRIKPLAVVTPAVVQRRDEFIIGQLPMPVSRSGVMFGATSLPNGVCSASPPANGCPPGAV